MGKSDCHMESGVEGERVWNLAQEREMGYRRRMPSTVLPSSDICENGVWNYGWKSDAVRRGDTHILELVWLHTELWSGWTGYLRTNYKECHLRTVKWFEGKSGELNSHYSLDLVLAFGELLLPLFSERFFPGPGVAFSSAVLRMVRDTGDLELLKFAARNYVSRPALEECLRELKDPYYTEDEIASLVSMCGRDIAKRG